MRKHLPIKWLVSLSILGVGLFPISARANLYDLSGAITTQQKKSDVVIVVTDSQEQPLIGAMVISVEDPSTAGIVGADGKVTMSVASNSSVTLQMMGYKTQTVAIGGRTTFGVVMDEDAIAVDEVVVVGYGTQKKVNLTGSVAAVDGEELSLRPVTNATQALQGLVPGLTASSGETGRPGSSASVSLRGQGNLKGDSNPYVLVDGVEMNLDDVNPNDIESISVLKDAASSAIYGSRAAFGVILVTTKKGKNEDARVSYQGSVAWSSPTTLPEMSNGYDFAMYFNQCLENSNTAHQYDKDKLILLKEYCYGDKSKVDTWADLESRGVNNLVAAFENTPYGVGSTDYFDLHYKDFAFKQNHNLSVSGGSEKTQYYISAGYYSEEGLLKYADMDFKRYNFKGNVNTQINNWLKARVNTTFTHVDKNTPFSEGYTGVSEAFYHNLARFRPTVDYIDPNGNFTELTQIPYLTSGTYTNTKGYLTSISGALEANPAKNWNIILDYTYRNRSSDFEALNVAPQILAADGETYYPATRSELLVQSDGRFTRRSTATHYQTINAYTNYAIEVGEGHNFSIMGGYQEEYNRYNYMNAYANGQLSISNPGLSTATGDQIITETRNHWATRGFFGRFNYDYKGRYLVEANVRYDGSSRFASTNRWGTFPSVSVGWNIAQEKFMEPARDVLNTLKLRGSYGRVGNQAGASMYTFASTMGITAQGGWIFADGKDMYINSPNVVDPNVTWEKVESVNIGVDFGMFNNQLTGSFDIFQRDTKDMLGPSIALPDTFGADVPDVNNANMRNRGWEFNVNYRGKIGSDISYSVGAMIYDATSEVTAYENPTGTNPHSAWYVGKKVGEIWGFRGDGIIQTQDEADTYNKYNRTEISSVDYTPGDLRYRDLNKDGIIGYGSNTLGDMGDREIIGNTTPRYQYSINGMISWKGLTLSMIFQGVGKRDFDTNASDYYFWGHGPYAQVTVFNNHLDYWTEDNRDAYYPKPYTGTAATASTFRNKSCLVTDTYMLDASYCRLKNLTLSYNLPSKFTEKIGLSKTQIYFTGENLFTISNLPNYFDPEQIFVQSEYGDSTTGGKNYPNTRVFSFGITLNL